MESKQQNQSKEEKKILANYDSSMAKALSILNGEAFRPVSKISSEGIADIMDEFFKEEIEDKKKDFKIKFKSLLTEKVEFDKFIKQKEQEFKKVILQKKKEFTGKVESVVSIIDGIDKMKTDYLTSLSAPETEK